jgi:ribosomal protein L28
MAKTCEHCDKKKQMGHTRKLLRGHYNVTAIRTFRPNLQKIKHNGEHLLLCVNCIRTLNKAAKVK